MGNLVIEELKTIVNQLSDYSITQLSNYPIPMGRIVPDAIERYLSGLNRQVDAVLAEIARDGEARELPLVDAEVGAFLQVLARAVGAYPARAVQTLDAVIRDAEESVGASARGFAGLEVPRTTGQHDHTSALCEAAVTLAERAGAAVIVAVTRGGGTAQRLSALRPHAPILATTDRSGTSRRLALLWGVQPLHVDLPPDDESARQLGEELVTRGLVPEGTDVVFVSINPDLSRREANFLKIHRI